MTRRVICASRRILDIDWRELWSFRDLLWLLVRRDLVAVYKQTILGPAWFVIQPLATTLVFTVVFGKVARVSTDGTPQFLFYMCGTMFWSYFQACMISVGNSLVSHAGIFRKVYYPRLITPLSLVVSNLAKFLISIGMFFVFYVGFAVFTDAELHPTAWMALLPVLVLQSALIGLAVGLWFTAATTKYHDLGFAITFIAQLWLYATPVVYPASLVSGRWRWLLMMNPMSGVIEQARAILLGRGVVTPPFVLCGWVITVLLVFSGLLVFNAAQRTFVDTI